MRLLFKLGHVAKVTLEKLNVLGYETLLHLPYSFDLSPSNYYLKKKSARHFFYQKDSVPKEK